MVAFLVRTTICTLVLLGPTVLLAVLMENWLGTAVAGAMFSMSTAIDIFSELLEKIPMLGELAGMLIDGLAVPYVDTQTAVLEKATYTLMLLICSQLMIALDRVVCSWMPMESADGWVYLEYWVVSAATCAAAVINAVVLARTFVYLFSGVPILWFVVLVGIVIGIAALYIKGTKGSLVEATIKFLMKLMDVAVLYLMVLCYYNLYYGIKVIECGLCMVGCTLYITILSAKTFAGS